MHKSTNFSGQPVYNQLLKLITRQSIEQLNKGWQIISEEYAKSPPKVVEYSLNFEQGAYFFKNKSEMPIKRHFGQVFF